MNRRTHQSIIFIVGIISFLLMVQPQMIAAQTTTTTSDLTTTTSSYESILSTYEEVNETTRLREDFEEIIEDSGSIMPGAPGKLDAIETTTITTTVMTAETDSSQPSTTVTTTNSYFYHFNPRTTTMTVEDDQTMEEESSSEVETSDINELPGIDNDRQSVNGSANASFSMKTEREALIEEVKFYKTLLQKNMKQLHLNNFWQWGVTVITMNRPLQTLQFIFPVTLSLVYIFSII